MKNIGYIFLAAGFLAGAYATALDVQNVNWMLFTGAAVIAVAGLVIAKTQASAHARSDKVLEVNRGELRESLQNIVTRRSMVRPDITRSYRLCIQRSCGRRGSHNVRRFGI